MAHPGSPRGFDRVRALFLQIVGAAAVHGCSDRPVLDPSADTSTGNGVTSAPTTGASVATTIDASTGVVVQSTGEVVHSTGEPSTGSSGTSSGGTSSSGNSSESSTSGDDTTTTTTTATTTTTTADDSTTSDPNDLPCYGLVDILNLKEGVLCLPTGGEPCAPCEDACYFSPEAQTLAQALTRCDDSQLRPVSGPTEQDDQCCYMVIAGCCITPGRPLVVAGQAHVAKSAPRDVWQAALPWSPPDLNKAIRDEATGRWTRAALVEHASIAAFARFAMQLLAMGAPPRLIADAQAAMGDELGHARVCFGLASAYAGRDVGPGALDIREALAGDAREFVVTAVHEGCVGETVAALEASEAARHAVDPVVRAALAEIAVDEGRHAELAWRFVQWAVQRDPGLRAAAVEAFATALDGVAAGGQGREDLLRFGVLGPAARGSLRRAALAQVIGPCARTLLAGPRVDAAVASAVASA